MFHRPDEASRGAGRDMERSGIKVCARHEKLDSLGTDLKGQHVCGKPPLEETGGG
jgi:hypothetical protein